MASWVIGVVREVIYEEYVTVSVDAETEADAVERAEEVVNEDLFFHGDILDLSPTGEVVDVYVESVVRENDDNGK